MTTSFPIPTNVSLDADSVLSEIEQDVHDLLSDRDHDRFMKFILDLLTLGGVVVMGILNGLDAEQVKHGLITSIRANSEYKKSLETLCDFLQKLQAGVQEN